MLTGVIPQTRLTIDSSKTRERECHLNIQITITRINQTIFLAVLNNNTVYLLETLGRQCTKMEHQRTPKWELGNCQIQACK